MGNVIGTEWEMPVVLAGMYGLRISEILGLRTTNIDLDKMQFGVVEQLPFKLAPGTKIISELAPTKSNDRILPITEETLPYFLRQFELIERQKMMIEAGGGKYFDNKLFVPKADGSSQSRDRVSANFGQLIRHLELPHIRFHDLRHTCASLLLANGVPMKQIQVWLGHSTFSTTADIYAHLDMSAQIQTGSVAGALFGQGKFNGQREQA